MRIFRGDLVKQAGGYLHNVIREPNETCQVCCTPVDGYSRCYKCNLYHNEFGHRLADLVVPLTYAVKSTTSGLLMRGYKDSRVLSVSKTQSATVADILYYGLVRHEHCIEKSVGSPVDVRVTIPSLQNRPGIHPLTAISDQMKATSDAMRLLPFPGAVANRTVGQLQFMLEQPEAASGRHVMVIDDTWTSGANGQSAALTLRNAGAKHVTVLTVSRWLEPGYGVTAQFIKTRLGNDYEPDCCPVTGASCPV